MGSCVLVLVYSLDCAFGNFEGMHFYANRFPVHESVSFGVEMVFVLALSSWSGNNPRPPSTTVWNEKGLVSQAVYSVLCLWELMFQSHNNCAAVKVEHS